MEYAFSRRRTRPTQRRIYGASSFHYRLDANAFGFARARRVQSLEPFRGRWRDCTFDPCGPAESGFRSCGRIRKGPLWARNAQHELVARIEARWAGTCQARTTVKRPRPPRTVKRQTGSRAKHVADVGSKREMLKKAARYQLLVDFAERPRASIAERTAKARVLAQAIWAANADRHATHVPAIIRDGRSKLDRCTNNSTRAFSVFGMESCSSRLSHTWGAVKKRRNSRGCVIRLIRNSALE